MHKNISTLCYLLFFWPLLFYGQHPFSSINSQNTYKIDSVKPLKKVSFSSTDIIVSKTVRIEEYFTFMDSLINSLDSLKSAVLNEHLIVHSNFWIIDTLKATDYYLKKEKDSFVYDQKKMVVLKKGDTLHIPGSEEIEKLNSFFSALRMDINIPEFLLRIYKKDSLLYEFDIRVGQNRKKYLAMSKRITNLRTLTGKGKIIAHHKNPVWYNPVTMKRYLKTRRDDGKTTLLPQIPWLETEIDGIKNGQMIHPTTNPETLGKPYSNGCMGTREGDAWIVYYHAPINTSVTIRYDLIKVGAQNKKTLLEDIYN